MGDEALGIAKLLLARNDIKVNLPNKESYTPLIWCCQQGDKSLCIAKLLLSRNDIKVNLQSNNGDTPLDKIIDEINENRKNYTYVKLWDILISKGAVLNKEKTAYENLNPSNFQEPQQTYVRLIKQTPPKNSTNTKFMHNEEEIKEDE